MFLWQGLTEFWALVPYSRSKPPAFNRVFNGRDNRTTLVGTICCQRRQRHFLKCGHKTRSSASRAVHGA